MAKQKFERNKLHVNIGTIREGGRTIGAGRVTDIIE